MSFNDIRNVINSGADGVAIGSAFIERIEKEEKETVKTEESILKEEKNIVKQTKDKFLFGLSKKTFITVLSVLIVIVVVAVLILAHIIPLLPSAPANSAGFFLGPIGQPLSSTYVNELGNLSSQLQAIGEAELDSNLSSGLVSSVESAGFSRINNTNIFCSKPSVSSSGSTPGYCILMLADGNYAAIPIKIPKSANASNISVNGKPTFFYLGAQGCPFCAQQRYAVAIALDRFGKISKLFYDRSATNDGNIPTFLFNFSEPIFKEGVSLPPIVQNGKAVAPGGDEYASLFFTGNYYSSPYINFESFDQVGGSFLTSAGIANLEANYSDVYSKIISPAESGFGISDFSIAGVPFFDINNQYVFDGANLNAEIVFSQTSSYSTHADMFNSIEDPKPDSFGETALAAANILTAEICNTISNKAPVCNLSYIKGLQQIINSINYSKLGIYN